MKATMTSDQAHAWKEALRSGKYPQTHYALVISDEVKPEGYDEMAPNGYCCLGVLCSAVLGMTDYDITRSGYSRIQDLMPDKTMYCFWDLNDEKGLTFSRIADLVDETLAKPCEPA